MYKRQPPSWVGKEIKELRGGEERERRKGKGKEKGKEKWGKRKGEKRKRGRVTAKEREGWRRGKIGRESEGGGEVGKGIGRERYR